MSNRLELFKLERRNLGPRYTEGSPMLTANRVRQAWTACAAIAFAMPLLGGYAYPQESNAGVKKNELECHSRLAIRAAYKIVTRGHAHFSELNGNRAQQYLKRFNKRGTPTNVKGHLLLFVHLDRLTMIIPVDKNDQNCSRWWRLSTGTHLHLLSKDQGGNT